MHHSLKKLKGRIGSLWWYGGLSILFMRVADLANFYISTFIAPDHIHPDALGAIIPLMRLITLAAVPLSILAITYLRFATKFEAQDERGKTCSLIRDLARLAILCSLLLFALTAWGIPIMQEKLQVEGNSLFWIVALAGCVACWNQVVLTGVKGLQAFRFMILGSAIGPLVRLVVTATLAAPMQLTGYFIGLFSGMMTQVTLMLKDFGPLLRSKHRLASYRSHHREMVIYTLPIAAKLLALNLLFILEPWIIRQRLSFEDSAGFFMIFNLGRIPAFLMAAFIPLILPIMSKRHEEAQPTHRLHMQSLWGATVLGLAITTAFFLFSEDILKLRTSWQAFLPYASICWMLCLISTLETLFITHATHLDARSSFKYMYYFLPIVLLEMAFLLFMGTGGALVHYMDGFMDTSHLAGPESLIFYIAVFLAMRVCLAIFVIIHSFCLRKHSSKNDFSHA